MAVTVRTPGANTLSGECQHTYSTSHCVNKNDEKTMCSSDVAVTVTLFCGSTDQIAAIRSVPVGASFGFSLPVTGQNQAVVTSTQKL